MFRFLSIATVVSIVAFFSFIGVATALTGNQLPQITNNGVYWFFATIGFITSAIFSAD